MTSWLRQPLVKPRGPDLMGAPVSARIYLAPAGLLLIAICTIFASIACSGKYQYWDDAPIWGMLTACLFFSLAMICFLLAPIFSERGKHRVSLLAFWALALAGSGLAVQVAVPALNESFDTSEETLLCGLVEEKIMTKGRKGRARYELRMTGLHYAGSGLIQSVPREWFDRVTEREHVRLHLRDGYFAIRYIQRLEPAPGGCERKKHT